MTILGKGIIVMSASLLCKIVNLSRLVSQAHYQNEIVFFYFLDLDFVGFHKTLI